MYQDPWLSNMRLRDITQVIIKSYHDAQFSNMSVRVKAEPPSSRATTPSSPIWVWESRQSLHQVVPRRPVLQYECESQGRASIKSYHDAQFSNMSVRIKAEPPSSRTTTPSSPIWVWESRQSLHQVVPRRPVLQYECESQGRVFIKSYHDAQFSNMSVRVKAESSSSRTRALGQDGSLSCSWGRTPGRWSGRRRLCLSPDIPWRLGGEACGRCPALHLLLRTGLGQWERDGSLCGYYGETLAGLPSVYMI